MYTFFSTKKLSLGIGFLFGIISYCHSQKISIDSVVEFKQARLEVVVFKNSYNAVKSFRFINNSDLIPEKFFFKDINPDFAISASIVDSSCQPKGLFIEHSKMIQPANFDSVGVGNFYLPQNGVYFFANGIFSIEGIKSFKHRKDIDIALQTGPMLVLKGRVNTVFGENSPNKHIRCGVGIFENNGMQYVIFAKSIDPINFYDLASFFLEKYNCKSALAIESGKNASMYFSSKNKNRLSMENTACRYLVLEFLRN